MLQAWNRLKSRTFAQFGGALILVSLALPWFASRCRALAHTDFRVWELDKGAFVLVAAYGLLAISQIRMSSRDSMALIYHDHRRTDDGRVRLQDLDFAAGFCSATEIGGPTARLRSTTC